MTFGSHLRVLALATLSLRGAAEVVPVVRSLAVSCFLVNLAGASPAGAMPLFGLCLAFQPLLHLPGSAGQGLAKRAAPLRSRLRRHRCVRAP